MAQQMYLLTTNNFVYDTTLADFETNVNESKIKNRDYNTFLIILTNKQQDIENPPINLIKALPIKDLKERWIEKNYNVLVPVDATKEEIDNFLIKLSSWTQETKENLKETQKVFNKLNKGDSITFSSKEGKVTIKFGEDFNPNEEANFLGTNGSIKSMRIPCVIEARNNKFNIGKKSGEKDSEGNNFDFIVSPTMDVEQKIKDMVKGETNTIAKTKTTKYVLKNVQKMTESNIQDPEKRVFSGEMQIMIID